MSTFFMRGMLAAIALSLAGFAAPTAAADLRLHGSNTIGEKLAPALVDAWAAQQGWVGGQWIDGVPNEKSRKFVRAADSLQVSVYAHGTGTGLARLQDANADVWMASRPVKTEEVQASSAIGRLDTPTQEHVVALDGLAVVVHPENAVRVLTVDQVRDVFAGRITDWREVGGRAGPIAIHARDDKSGTFDTFKSLVLGDQALSASAKRFESTSDLSSAVAQDRNAIGFVGIAGVGGARALSLADVGTRPLSPGLFTVATEDYVLSRRLFFYTPARTSLLTRNFVEFAQSSRGQEVVARIGFVAQSIALIDQAPRKDAGDEYLKLTTNAKRVSVNFRFDTGVSYLDGKALRDLDRLVSFVRSGSSPDDELVLIGFSDANEVNAYQAIAMSADRADYVAAQLLRRGVAPARIRGVGQVAPVAANTSSSGRARNRRVEVWVKPAVAAVAPAAPSASASY